MNDSLKKCWYWFINLLTNGKFKKPPEKNTDINNLESKELNILSVKVRYIKEKEN